jgi:glycolate oxidase
VLPSTTEEVSRVLAYCHRWGIKVVARGAGTSLSGGALPAEDAVVNHRLAHEPRAEIDYVNRVARVEVGITNLAISDAVNAGGFFYAPDPSEPAGLHAGRQHRHELGGRALPQIWRDDQ